MLVHVGMGELKNVVNSLLHVDNHEISAVDRGMSDIQHQQFCARVFADA